MASSSEDAIVGETVALDNATNASAPGRQAASFEGLMTAYIALLIMSLLPIYIGALRSVRFHGDLKVSMQENGSKMSAEGVLCLEWGDVCKTDIWSTIFMSKSRGYLLDSNTMKGFVYQLDICISPYLCPLNILL